MRNNSLSMARYVEAARAHHDLNPQDEHALHEQHLESLGLSSSAKEHLINERMASVAAHLSRNESARANISKMDERSQVKELDRIHSKEQRGANSDTEDDNEKTDSYLAERGKVRR
jgi:hypothetical protein